MTFNVRQGMFRLYVVVSSLWVLVVAVVAVNVYRPNATSTYSDIEIEQAILKAEWEVAGDHRGVDPKTLYRRGHFVPDPPVLVLVPEPILTVEFDNNTTTTTVRNTKKGETIVLPVGLASKETMALKDIVRGVLLDAHRKTERTRLLKYFFNTSLAALGPPLALLLFWSLGTWIVAGFKSRETFPADK
jgi:hypothetical protein